MQLNNILKFHSDRLVFTKVRAQKTNSPLSDSKIICNGTTISIRPFQPKKNFISGRIIIFKKSYARKYIKKINIIMLKCITSFQWNLLKKQLWIRFNCFKWLNLLFWYNLIKCLSNSLFIYAYCIYTGCCFCVFWLSYRLVNCFFKLYMHAYYN